MKRTLLACVLISTGALSAACAGQSAGDEATGEDAATSGAAGPGGGFVSGGGACEPVVYQGQALPLDLFLVVDASGSMTDGDPTRWTATATAVKAFASSPGASGVGAGLLVFPRLHELGLTGPDTVMETCATCAGDACTIENGCTCDQVPIDYADCGSCATGCGCWSTGGCAETSCTTADYVAPDVEIGSLPGAEPAIAQVVDGRNPAGGTATGLAYSQAAQYVTGWAVNQPDQNVALVLIAAGEPSACEPITTAGIAEAGAALASGPAAIRTFVISLGDLPALDALAAAGGSEDAIALTGPDLATALGAALEQVRQESRSCAYSIPVPSSGSVDPAKVNVRVHGSDHDLKQVSGAGACAPSGGWYYDDPQNPRKILLCHESCGALPADAGGGADVLLGCDTEAAK
jgi:hypothetical protein